jgi:hypothetical protein
MYTVTAKIFAAKIFQVWSEIKVPSLGPETQEKLMHDIPGGTHG